MSLKNIFISLISSVVFNEKIHVKNETHNETTSHVLFLPFQKKLQISRNNIHMRRFLWLRESFRECKNNRKIHSYLLI